MAEFRKDPLTGNWVVVGVKTKEPRGTGACPFCPGNEYLTPPTIRETKDAYGLWLVRCFSAANPVFEIEASEKHRKSNVRIAAPPVACRKRKELLPLILPPPFGPIVLHGPAPMAHFRKLSDWAASCQEELEFSLVVIEFPCNRGGLNAI